MHKFHGKLLFHVGKGWRIRDVYSTMFHIKRKNVHFCKVQVRITLGWFHTYLQNRELVYSDLVEYRLTSDCCIWFLNSSIVVLDTVMSLNIPSSLDVNWQPHSVCKQNTKQYSLRLSAFSSLWQQQYKFFVPHAESFFYLMFSQDLN